MMNEKKTENQRNKKKKGYSLIEALVALGILLLGIVPVVTVATRAMLFHHRASETEEAARVSQTMIDYIKSRGYDNLELIVDVAFPNAFENPYTIRRVTTEGPFTVDNFGGHFGIDDDLIVLNSKGINLSQVNFYVVMDKVKGNLKDFNNNTDSYTDPITGEKNKNNVYREDLIYGKFIFGFGNTTTDTAKKTGREKEMETTFIMTPIENWK